MNVMLAEQFIGATLFYVIFLFSWKIKFRLFESGLKKYLKKNYFLWHSTVKG